ncbi:MAG: S1C family serine protease [Planctomycetota bacterium]
MDTYQASPYPPAPPRNSLNRLLVILLLLLSGLLLWRSWPFWRGSGIDPDAVARVVAPRGALADDEKSTIEIFRNASPSVVHITTTGLRQNAFTLNVQEIPRGSGSGFIWDDQGHIVTNFHVLEGASSAQVTLADHSTWRARLVGAFPDKDLAVLIIDAPKRQLIPIPIGSSADLEVGQKVFAIGNPFGLDQTLTTGVISAVGREIKAMTGRPIRDVIQTDAAINPGNSGGPLLDSAGRLIGVNTAIFSPSGAYAGIGFAIPVDEVNRAVPQLIRHGKVIRPGLGVRLAPDRVSRNMKLPGPLVVGVEPGSAADRAGIRATVPGEDGEQQLGDVIVAVEGNRVTTVADLLNLLSEYGVDDKVKITVQRDGEEQEIEITLGNIGF